MAVRDPVRSRCAPRRRRMSPPARSEKGYFRSRPRKWGQAANCRAPTHPKRPTLAAIRCLLPPFFYPTFSLDLHPQAAFPLCPKIERTISNSCDMETKCKAIAEGVLESSWLVALAIIPLFFNSQSARVFEGDKAALLRTLALLVVPFFAVWLYEVRAQLKWRAPASLWQVPLVKPALVFVAVYAAATAVSIAPRWSFFGSYDRMQGLYLWLCYPLVFLCVLLVARRPAQVDRVMDTLLLASVIPGLYAIFQAAGYDPITWSDLFRQRIVGNFGNPIFLGGFLVLVVPPTVSRIWEYGLRVRSDGMQNPQPGRPGMLLTLGVYVLLLLCQLSALVFTASRGPMIGLGVGVAFYGLIVVAKSQKRWIARSLACLAVLLMLSLAACLMAGVRREAARHSSGKGISISQRLDPRGTITVRLLIWEGAGKLLSSNPARLILGYGPETIELIYSRAYPPGLAHVEDPTANADRSHNETFDLLLTTGILGLCASLAFLLAVLALVLGRLGLIDSRPERICFLSAASLGAAAGWLLPYLLLRNFQLSGIGMPAGLLVGMALYLLVRAGWAALPLPVARGRYDLLLIGLFAAVIAHFVEIQFGIATVTTWLYFWALAGLAGAVAISGGNGEAEDQVRGNTNPAGKGKVKRAEAPRSAANLRSPEMILGSLVGLISIVFTFALYDRNRGIWALALVSSAVWIFGAVVARERVRAGDGEGPRRFLLFRYTLVSLLPLLLFAAIQIPWMHDKASGEGATVEMLTQSVLHIADAVIVVSIFVFLMLGLLAYFLFFNNLRGGVKVGFPLFWRIAAVMLLMSASVLIAWRSNVDYSRADVLVKQASLYEKAREWDASLVLRRESMRLQSEERTYRRQFAYALVWKAGSSADRALQGKLLAEAEVHLLGLWQYYRLSSDDAWVLAKLYRMWDSVGAEAAPGKSLRSEAEKYYRRASDLFPTSAAILNDWAAFYLERQEPVKALERLEWARKVDDGFSETHLLRAKALVQQRAYEPALAEFERALALAPDSADARAGRAAMLNLFRK